jgi:oligopeptide/dipeptide ABC transporter ATP-binding protein
VTDQQVKERPSGTSKGNGETLLKVEDLYKYFPIKGGLLGLQTVAHVHAVDGVSFEVRQGETLGLVGESGCGKTTLGKVILQLLEATEGDVELHGKSIVGMSKEERREVPKQMQVVFQDPYASLNPRMTVGEIVGEGPMVNGMTDKDEREGKVRDLLARVGLNQSHVHRYPHEFSGGQRQRIGIARALALNPDFIVLDEPVSALDVSIQSQVLNLLADLQEEFGLTYLFIAHNLAVVQHISDRVGVMYLGKLVELAEVESLYSQPRHPYSVALLSAVPEADPRRRKKRLVLKGDVPSPVAPPPGCRFNTRCWLKEQVGDPERCETEVPELRDIGAGHMTACHFAEEVTPEAVAQAAENQQRDYDAAAAAKAAGADIDPDDDAGSTPTDSGGSRKRRLPLGAGMLLRGGRRKRR